MRSASHFRQTLWLVLPVWVSLLLVVSLASPWAFSEGLREEDAVEREIGIVARRLQEMEEDLNQQDWTLARLEERLEAEGDAVRRLEEALGVERLRCAAILRLMVRSRPSDMVAALLSTQQASEIGMRMHYLEFFMRRSADALQAYRGKMDRYKNVATQVENTRKRLKSFRERLLLEKATLMQEKLKRELPADASREEDIDQEELPNRIASILSFEERKGHLPWPVEGYALRYYKQSEDDPSASSSKARGVEIAALLESKVHPVAPGKVVFAGPLRGYGKLVIVDHGEMYYSLYGYLGELEVAVGQKLGWADAIGKVSIWEPVEEPLLYFDIRHFDEPEDPLTWLRTRPGVLVKDMSLQEEIGALPDRAATQEVER